jgi:hypothetical protein
MTKVTVNDFGNVNNQRPGALFSNGVRYAGIFNSIQGGQVWSDQQRQWTSRLGWTITTMSRYAASSHKYSLCRNGNP